jgi:hypothetical protein
MPTIASHHLNDPWRPVQAWPDACYVQWGGDGVVLGRNSYRTAFFEAFPKDGSAGFIRGEGATVTEAEQSAFRQWSAAARCQASGGHLWSRTRRDKSKEGVVRPHTYTNGGCFCLKCHAFQTVMKPVVKLGAWRDPLGRSELQSIASGYCRGDGSADRPEQVLWRRRMALRAALAGIKLPPVDMPCAPKAKLFESDEYERACARAVVDYYRANSERLENNVAKDGIDLLFDAMSISYLRSLAEEHPESGIADD